MERVTGIGGVFIRSTQPAALRARYAEHLGLDVNEEWGGAVLASGGGETLTWAVFPGAVGAPVDDRVEELELGRFGWAADPEGNRFELWEPAAGH